MAYFPHAFQKLLVGLPKTQIEDFITDTVLTTAIAPGQIGVVDKATNLTIDVSNLATAVYANHPIMYLAQGSFHTVDTLGNSFHGGYQETIKSQGINPKYVSDFYVTTPADPLNEIWTVCAEGCELPCETTYRLRIDVKGVPVLRALDRNMYYTVDAYTGCCTDPDQPNFVDPNTVLLQWADEINAQNQLNKFVRASVINMLEEAVDVSYSDASTLVTDDAAFVPVEGMIIIGTDIPIGSYVGDVTPVGAAPITAYEFTVVDADGNLVTIPETLDGTVDFFETIDTDTYVPATGEAIADVMGCLVVEAAYVDTTFGVCSYDPSDFVGIEPLELNLSVVDQTGDPCVNNCFTATERQNAYQGKGFADPLIKEYILFKRYRQEDYHYDPRMREILDDTTMSCGATDIAPNAKYYTYNILHSIPRKSNPSGTMDNDQYLIKIVVDARHAQFEAWMDAYLASAGNHVQLREEV